MPMSYNMSASFNIADSIGAFTKSRMDGPYIATPVQDTSDWYKLRPQSDTEIAITNCSIPLIYESIFHMNLCISKVLSTCLSLECLWRGYYVCIGLSASVYCAFCLCYAIVRFTLLSKRFCFCLLLDRFNCSRIYLQSKTSNSSSYTKTSKALS